MKINISNLGCNSFYMYIVYHNMKVSKDIHIARLLNIKYDEHIISMMYYGAHKSITEYFFNNEQDCENFIKFIKEKYNNKLVYLALIENTEEAKEIITNVVF